MHSRNALVGCGFLVLGLAAEDALLSHPGPPFHAQSVNVTGIPRRIEIGDVDGDGDADLVVLSASTLASGLTVVRNDGAGSFSLGWEQALTPLPLDFEPDLEVGDMDADGDLDLLVNLPFTGPASAAYLNAGDGTFGESKPISVAGQRVEHELADLDGDVFLDYAYYELDLIGYVGSRKGAGDGTFSFGPEVSGGNYDADARTALGDVTGDAFEDLVLASEHGLLVVTGTLGTPVQGWGSTTQLASGDFDDAAIADVDGDGALDIVASKPASQAVALLLGSPPGPPTFYPAGGKPRAVCVADLDGEGMLDIVVTSARTGELHVLYGAGGVFTPPVVILDADRPEDVAAGDLDGDGDVDLAVADSAAGRVWVLFNLLIP